MDWGTLFFSFSGRINRAKFWIASLVLMTAFVIPFMLAVASMSTVIWLLAVVVFVAATISGLAVGAKRLHDRDRSAWWLVLFYLGPGLLQAMGEAMGGIDVIFLVISIGISIWAFVELGCLRGTPGPNRFGPDPLAGAGAQPGASRVS
jgi:uncharacterized membrane protein YhaH (DUF805 family)